MSLICYIAVFIAIVIFNKKYNFMCFLWQCTATWVKYSFRYVMTDTHCLNSRSAHWPRLRPQSRHCCRPRCFRFRCQPQVLLRPLHCQLLHRSLEPLQLPPSWIQTDVCPGQFRRPRRHRHRLESAARWSCWWSPPLLPRALGGPQLDARTGATSTCRCGRLSHSQEPQWWPRLLAKVHSLGSTRSVFTTSLPPTGF